jgi:hypothetical protein
MTELQWPPDVVGRLTIGQLAALAFERPPGEPGSGKKSFEEMAAALAAAEAEAAAWAGSPPE